jgi:hypothetical protein
MSNFHSSDETDRGTPETSASLGARVEADASRGLSRPVHASHTAIGRDRQRGGIETPSVGEPMDDDFTDTSTHGTSDERQSPNPSGLEGGDSGFPPGFWERYTQALGHCRARALSSQLGLVFKQRDEARAIAEDKLRQFFNSNGRGSDG